MVPVVATARAGGPAGRGSAVALPAERTSRKAREQVRSPHPSRALGENATPARPAAAGSGIAFLRISPPGARSTTVDHLSFSCRPLSFVRFFARKRGAAGSETAPLRAGPFRCDIQFRSSVCAVLLRSSVLRFSGAGQLRPLLLGEAVLDLFAGLLQLGLGLLMPAFALEVRIARPLAGTFFGCLWLPLAAPMWWMTVRLAWSSIPMMVPSHDS